MALGGLALLPAHAATGAHEMVVTEQHLATDVGLQILHQGGNAIDAAVAIGYAEAVVYPCCGNLGGGGFMLIHRLNGANYFLDFRETAPLAARVNMYAAAPKSSREGWLAVAVPGTVMGLETARARFGRLSRAADLAPAIALARQGFVLGDHDADLLKRARNSALFPAPLKSGDRLLQPDLARTLATISAQGPAGFYQGALPHQIQATSAAYGGILTWQDFAAYQVKWRDPVVCHYRGYDITSAAPPSSGGTALCEALNILSGYNLRALGFHSASSINRIAEAERHVFLDRNTALGDPDFVADPIAHLTDPAYAAAIRATITPDRATPSANLPPGTAPHEKYETTHYSVVDREGNAASVTYTLNGLFGAQVEAPGTGVILNDEMDDFTTNLGQSNMFSLRQGVRNEIAPGKRPLSSTSPTLVTRNGKLVMVLGSPGGSRIISVVLQTIINVIDYNLPIDQAVAAPRVHMQYLPDTLFTEPNALPPATIQALQAMGYQVKTVPRFGAAESIEVVDGQYLGVNDPRAASGSAEGD
jgi:gamma-glutamyltranspeptidase/glutathione hydrolase